MFGNVVPIYSIFKISMNKMLFSKKKLTCFDKTLLTQKNLQMGLN